MTRLMRNSIIRLVNQLTLKPTHKVTGGAVVGILAVIALA
jgi:hypothetical protein